MSDTITRQIDILRLIPEHPRKITTSELKSLLENEEHRVTIRTIQRDIDKLSTKFALLNDGNKTPGWYWMEGAERPDLPKSTEPNQAPINIPRFENNHLGKIYITCPTCGADNCYIWNLLGDMEVKCEFCGIGHGTCFMDIEDDITAYDDDEEFPLTGYIDSGQFTYQYKQEIEAFKQSIQEKLELGATVNEASYTQFNEETEQWETVYIVEREEPLPDIELPRSFDKVDLKPFYSLETHKLPHTKETLFRKMCIIRLIPDGRKTISIDLISKSLNKLGLEATTDLVQQDLDQIRDTFPIGRFIYGPDLTWTSDTRANMFTPLAQDIDPLYAFFLNAENSKHITLTCYHCGYEEAQFKIQDEAVSLHCPRCGNGGGTYYLEYESKALAGQMVKEKGRFDFIPFDDITALKQKVQTLKDQGIAIKEASYTTPVREGEWDRLYIIKDGKQYLA